MRLSTALLALSVCLAQDSSVITLSNGIRFRITQHRQGSTPDQLKVEMKSASGSSFYRIFSDNTGLAVYAYEVAINRLTDGEHFQIVAKPAGNEFAAKFPNADGGKPTPTLAMPLESPPLGTGGQFTVEIPTNPGFFERRSDVIQVQPDVRADRSGSHVVSPPPLIRFAALRVFVNDQQVISNDSGRTVVGQFAMFYIPHRGGFFFSTQPVSSRPFAQIGTVDRLELKFNVDNEDYRCLATSNIMTQSERGQIWVYHDPNYKPEGDWTKSNPSSRDEFFTVGSDSLGWWLP